MDWKSQLASSIEAALERSMCATVEESAEETARRRKRWLRIQLVEDRVRRDPVYAEKLARRHAAFRDSISAAEEVAMATSTSTAPATVLTACAVRDGNLAARPPTTCSTQCPSSDVTVSASASALSATSTSSKVSVGDVPQVCSLDREPNLVTAMSTTSSADSPEDKELQACLSVERPLMFVAMKDVADDCSFVTGAPAVPLAVAALGVHDGSITSKHTVALPLKLMAMPLSKNKEPYMSPLQPKFTQSMVAWGSYVNQLHTTCSGMCSGLGCATIYSVCLLPWDPGEKPVALRDSVCSGDIAWGACVKQLDADLSGSWKNEPEVWPFLQFATGRMIPFLPWDPGQPLYGMSTKLIIASGVVCLQGNSRYEMFSCSLEFEMIPNCMVELLELQPWPSGKIFILVPTELRMTPDSYHGIMVLGKVIGEGTNRLQYLGELYEKQYTSCKRLQLGHDTHYRSECFAWNIACFLVGTCHACSVFGGCEPVISKPAKPPDIHCTCEIFMRFLFSRQAQMNVDSNLGTPLNLVVYLAHFALNIAYPSSWRSTIVGCFLHYGPGAHVLFQNFKKICVTLVYGSMLDALGYHLYSSCFPQLAVLSSSLPPAKSTDNGTYGILMAPHSRLVVVLVGILVVWSNSTTVHTIDLRSENTSFCTDPLPSADQGRLKSYKLLTIWIFDLIIKRDSLCTILRNANQLISADISSQQQLCYIFSAEIFSIDAHCEEIIQDKFIAVGVATWYMLCARPRPTKNFTVHHKARSKGQGNIIGECRQAEAKGGTNFNPIFLYINSVYIGCNHYFDYACCVDNVHTIDSYYYDTFAQVHAGQKLYLVAYLDQVHIGHDYCLGVFFEQVGVVFYLNLVKVCLNYDIHCDLGEDMKHQVLWDPGGSTWHRLEVKPKIKEGGMLATIPYYAVGWAMLYLYWAWASTNPDRAPATYTRG